MSENKRCLAIKSDKTRCKRNVNGSSLYCWQHVGKDEQKSNVNASQHLQQQWVNHNQHNGSSFFTSEHDGKIITRSGFECLVLPKDLYIFRGTTEGKKPRRNPAYYSDKKVAKLYIDHPDDCLGFQLSTNVELMRLDNIQNVKLLMKVLPEEDSLAVSRLTGIGLKSYLKHYTNKNKNEFSFVTNGYTNDWYEKHGIYTSLQVAMAINDIGYDGWYIGDHKIKRANNSWFHQEIVLTMPDLVLKESDKTCDDFKSKPASKPASTKTSTSTKPNTKVSVSKKASTKASSSKKSSVSKSPS